MPKMTVWDGGKDAEILQEIADLRKNMARPARLEPATPGLEGSGYEATGGSAEPLLPVYWGFRKPEPTQDDPSLLPIVTFLSPAYRHASLPRLSMNTTSSCARVSAA